VTRAPSVDDAFAPEGERWERISPRLATAYRAEFSIVVVAALAIMAVLAFWPLNGSGQPFVPRPLLGVLAVVVLGVYGWLWWLVGRRVRSWGYAERPDDLLVTSGILFRRLVIVPYGRMQLVDVTAGPIHRALGITTVQLHTAAATTDAHIPGLTPEVAAGLRDRLARLGEQRSAGL
jgi:membrane protein YdbS with pleckstrin-like domain